MMDCFTGLRHHAVIGSNNQNNNVGCLGTARPHGGERLVARGIKEGHHATLCFDVIGTNVLGNTTRFTGSHLGTSNIVKQRCLAMVDVTHDSNDRRP